jgi:hypothetical protein
MGLQGVVISADPHLKTRSHVQPATRDRPNCGVGPRLYRDRAPSLGRTRLRADS